MAVPVVDLPEPPGVDARENPTVAVVGLGYVGSCLAAALADRGLDVVGVDTDPVLVGELRSGHCRFREHELEEVLSRVTTAGRLRVTGEHPAVSAADVVVVAVGTPIRDDGSMADGQLRAACLALGEHLRPGQLVLLKSTLAAGTTRELVVPLLERGGLTAGRDFMLACTPERLAEGTALEELRTLPIVVGGIDARSTRAAAEFWRRALGVRVIEHESPEAAEITKLASNWWIDLNIALANELAMFCSLYDVDVLDVIEAANSLPKGSGNVNILLPSAGVGGSCLTKDPWMVWRSARSRGVELRTPQAGREVNEAMPAHTAQLVVDELVARGKDPARSKVAVLGLAFKNNTGDLRATPARGVIEALAKAGAEVSAHDPLVDPDQAEELLGVRPAESLHEAVRDADCLAILALHRCFEDLDVAALPVAESCLILDGRAYYPKETIARLRALGHAYRGIGR
ncbi:nucleotide sugar dehydrogenase [Streptosporangium sp. NPDC050855]|uniref:nucleotide sugar dehydrogenase n=1 Tax=Streptosporangium sp. NPDC050855 TaxID=3366194 RepID=UPI003788EE32